MSKVRVPKEIKDRVDAEIRRCIEIAENAYGQTFRFPKIKYDLRGTTAGWACDGTYTINLNSVLLMENLDKFIEGYDSTVAHEFAHLVDGIANPETRETKIVMTKRGYRRSKRSIHGPTWKRVMMLFGCDPSGRCHDYEVKNARVKKSSRKHVWVCGCGGGRIVLTNLKHRRQLAANGRRTYMRGHPFSRCGTYSYKGLDGQELPEMPIAASKPKKAPKKGTKKEKAIKIYRDLSHMPKDFVIAQIMIECDMTRTGATTYFYIAKKA